MSPAARSHLGLAGGVGAGTPGGARLAVSGKFLLHGAEKVFIKVSVSCCNLLASVWDASQARLQPGSAMCIGAVGGRLAAGLCRPPWILLYLG